MMPLAAAPERPRPDAGGPDAPARARRRRLLDRLAGRVVALGGLTVIASILAILLVIVAEVWPLFRAPEAALEAAVAPAGLAGAPLALAVDERREVAGLVEPSGARFVSLADGSRVKGASLPGLAAGERIVSAGDPGRGWFALGLSSGRVLAARIKLEAAFSGSERRLEPEIETGPVFTAFPDGRPARLAAFADAADGPTAAAVSGERDLVVLRRRTSRSLIGGTASQEQRLELALPVEGEVAALLVDGRGEEVFAGTSSGQLAVADLGAEAGEGGVPAAAARATRAPGVGVTALGFLLGDRTVVVGDSEGRVSTWQHLLDEGSARRLARIREFEGHARPVVQIVASQRDKCLLTADAHGVVKLHHGTTGRTLLTLRAEGDDLARVAFAPKADGLLAAGGSGLLTRWSLKNPHPEATLAALFGKSHYEGYARPEFVWQSTGGTDDFESKFSLTPLIYGTLKGTFYALLFAVPIALLAALYTSQFLHPRLKAVVKPTVELMAALPSVVLGFIAGLWLAPMLEKVVPGLFILPWTVVALVLLAAGAWRLVPLRIQGRLLAGSEVFLLVPVVLGAGWLAFELGGLVEERLLAGDYRGWLLGALGLTYDQRNSLVVGFAMGFAVIPIIFTIAEDSLSSVPRHLEAGSLALGATRWQTAVRVVLPTASPGIFSAVMVGFGRAVGETMIVLMATGNTPVMDWSIFNGFRALSANIAVELPEAPEGGTLYRVLFLAALLLFVLTFAVNTAAEVVRLQLRRRYRVL